MTTEKTDPQLGVRAIYLKQLHLDIAQTAAEVVEKYEKWEGKIDFKASTDQKILKDEQREATLKLEITCKQSDELIYTITLEQAGVFTVKHFKEEDEKAVLNGYCMNVLYPYACERVHALSVQAGFPPALLNPMNFEMLYRQYQKQAKETVAENGTIQ